MFETEVKGSPLLNYFESQGYNVDKSNSKIVIKNFAGLDKEINSLYNGVGLRDISHYGFIELKGNDVLDFLHRISTNSVKNVQKEQLTHTMFTTEKGRIIDITTLLNFEDFKLLVTSHEHQMKVMSWLQKYVITDDVKQSNINGKYAVFELLGPQSNSFVTLICGNIVDNINENTFKIINADGIIFFLIKLIDFNRQSKYWIIAEPTNGQRLVKFMQENYGIFDFNLIGEEAYNIYRVEKGIPSAPNEINDSYNPHEARLIDFVDFKKGCYIGQEVIARLDTYEKVQKYLTGVKFSGEINTSDTFILYDENEKDAGHVTSTVYSLKMKSYIGLAYVKKMFIEEEKEFTAKTETGKELKVLLHKLPFRK